MAGGKKQVDVNLRFTADSSQAKQQLQSLQQQLTQITNTASTSTIAGTTTQDINKAVQAASELKIKLQEATNVDTGKLDLSKLTQSLNPQQIQQYRKQLESIGPTGQQAFASFAQAITNAEIPLRKTNVVLDKFKTTLFNTFRWQVSSSLLMGVYSTIQGAYQYVQDLDKSLNNIRIVTGYSKDQMAEFAESANQAAKALNTTTTEYTKASLIFYQQGLDDKAVKERTDVTIKMANVSRDSAQTVSDQMTAVWNNFDDGSRSLEYYADVMTALGAATASSTSEIATGLEKFAAISNTVGLSYDYATTALATVTATTRQSADIVGTAFKTMFARIQDLELGKTDEDGTSLGLYSDALHKVGVEIKNLATGELKDMNQILDEMGARWKTLAKDEQVALAQTVAG